VIYMMAGQIKDDGVLLLCFEASAHFEHTSI
jgi:hypothetical protein